MFGLANPGVRGIHRIASARFTGSRLARPGCLCSPPHQLLGGVLVSSSYDSSMVTTNRRSHGSENSLAPVQVQHKEGTSAAFSDSILEVIHIGICWIWNAQGLRADTIVQLQFKSVGMPVVKFLFGT